MLTVNGDRDVVERQLAGGELACPSCGGVLGGRGNALERRVRVLEGPDVALIPRRSRCRGCGGTHVLLPAWCMSRRADAAAVIGAALEAAAAGDGHLGRLALSGQLYLRYFMLRAAGSGTRRGPLAESCNRVPSGDASDYSGSRCTGQCPPVLSFASGTRSGTPARP